jgi:chaperonin cofactor prefoldin
MSAKNRLWNLAYQYSTLQEQEKSVKSRLAALKKELGEDLELFGEPDDKGNLVFAFDEAAGNIVALQRQRRVGQGFDQEAAEEILKAKQVDEETTLWDACTEEKVIQELDDDAVLAAHFDDLLTDEELERIYPKIVTWAFAPVRKS